MRIVVAGATGALGTEVVSAVRAAGHEPVALSRASGVDLLDGSGLAGRLAGSSAVIDASSTSSTSARTSTSFFTRVTRNLLDAERAAGVGHYVGVSIIGAAGIDAGYYAGKAAQEAVLRAQPGGWSLLRTTQFYELVEQLAVRGRLGPLQIVPTMRSQPVAAAEVATELVAIASGEPRGLVRDLAGPKQERMVDLVRRYLLATDQHRRVMEVPLPGAFGRGLRDGSILPSPDARLGRQTFDDWLTTVSGPGPAGQPS